MHTLLSLIGILAVLAIGVVSPGPSFILVARTAIAVSRRAAIGSAMGMACGATVLCVAALLGLHALLSQIPELYLALKLFGGAYLLYLAFKLWRGAGAPLANPTQDVQEEPGLLRHFFLAVGTMLSNPKAAVQYGVIFAAMLPQSPSRQLILALPPAVFLLEVSWYTFVAFGLSSARPRNSYLKAKASIDRVVGLVLAGLGVRLLMSTR